MSTTMTQHRPLAGVPRQPNDSAHMHEPDQWRSSSVSPVSAVNKLSKTNHRTASESRLIAESANPAGLQTRHTDATLKQRSKKLLDQSQSLDWLVPKTANTPFFVRVSHEDLRAARHLLSGRGYDPGTLIGVLERLPEDQVAQGVVARKVFTTLRFYKFILERVKQPMDDRVEFTLLAGTPFAVWLLKYEGGIANSDKSGVHLHLSCQNKDLRSGLEHQIPTRQRGASALKTSAKDDKTDDGGVTEEDAEGGTFTGEVSIFGFEEEFAELESKARYGECNVLTESDMRLSATHRLECLELQHLKPLNFYRAGVTAAGAVSGSGGSGGSDSEGCDDNKSLDAESDSDTYGDDLPGESERHCMQQKSVRSSDVASMNESRDRSFSFKDNGSSQERDAVRRSSNVRDGASEGDVVNHDNAMPLLPPLTSTSQSSSSSSFLPAEMSPSKNSRARRSDTAGSVHLDGHGSPASTSPTHSGHEMDFVPMAAPKRLHSRSQRRSGCDSDWQSPSSPHSRVGSVFTDLGISDPISSIASSPISKPRRRTYDSDSGSISAGASPTSPKRLFTYNDFPHHYSDDDGF
eukprot:GFYU01004459.1.p1 GENE.GFYU01004459.1~~GFYU01004459.1.p1  ORF type:complete len:577 (-),score=93.04 GFYU01004459.1:56-1786(-)